MPSDPDQYLPKTKITHDGIFKEFFKQPQFCKELFSVLMSRHEYRQFDWSTLKLEPSEQTNVLGQQRMPDLVTTVRLNERSERLKLVCLLDHKSDARAEALRQLLEYAGIVIRQQKIPVMPIVIYNGESRQWRGPTRLHQALPGMDGELGRMFGNHIPDYELRIVNLREEATQQRSAGLSIEPVLYSMGRIWNASEKELEHLFRLSAAMSADDRKQMIPKMSEYFYRYNESITIETIMELEKRIVSNENNRIMQYNIYSWDVARQEGIEEGRQEGRQEGIKEARERHARKLLAKGMCIKDISDVTELTPKQVGRLRNNAD